MSARGLIMLNELVEANVNGLRSKVSLAGYCSHKRCIYSYCVLIQFSKVEEVKEWLMLLCITIFHFKQI